jgi:hypothetical protein
MTDIVERLRAERPQFYESTMKEAADKIEQLRQIYFDRVKEQADEIERLRGELRACGLDNEIYFNRCEELAVEIERLRALLKRHDDSWRLLHEPEYTGALRDDTRAAFGDAPKYDANFHPEGWDEVDGND